ncbi:hypothetical protein POM88_035567 [Heracleum sosnowskyi]|uniref:Ubiquitin-like protease family profile domain-containing protein n=1 Tax=Heracleum sosnowskyi TaxID=360622 RepID=A0AAD8HNR1_9APIA|nr:hypothetical protein POM88_035567 [Heracleum sosnowskyi]
MFFFLVKYKNAADDNIQHKNCNGVEWNDQGWGQWDNAHHPANLDTWEKVDDKGWGQCDNDQEVPNIFEENIQETQMESENLEENEDNAKQHSENSETQNKQDDIEKHSHFAKYLQAKGHSTLAKTIRKLKPSYLTMPWQTTKNSKDCGIFLMRHMETYKGDTKTWETRFREEKHGQVAQIIKMRVKYNNAILSSKLNEKRQPIMEEGLKLYNEAAANRVLNLVIQSSQLSQEAQKNGSQQKITK